MNTQKTKYILLTCFLVLVNIITSKAEKTLKNVWTYITVDSILIDNRTMIGKKHTESTGFCYYSYYIKELEVKRDSITSTKTMFGIGDNSPLWRNYWEFKKEFQKHSFYVRSLFENNKEGLRLNQLGISPYVLIDEDGSSFCYRIRSRIQLTNVFKPTELIEIFDKIGCLKYTAPIVKQPEHGYLEYQY